ncbi:MAG: T9SS type A sorting domain-containing protein [Flavobacteriales bacterium]|nr:T9SS type A sorting domain-containing protein [Flavobacteriales bacterium]
MKAKNTLLKVLVAFSTMLLQTIVNGQSWEWAKSFKGNNSMSNISKTTSIKLGKSGDLYIAGNFNDSIRIGNDLFVSTGIVPGFTTADGFLAKFNTSGDLVWLKQFSSALSVEISDIALDESGNIYTIGTFMGSVQVDTTLKSGSNNNATMMLSKFSPDGKLEWMNIALNGTGGRSRGLAVTAGKRDVIIAGDLEKKVKVGNTDLDGSGDIKFILARFLQDGSFVWSKAAGETNPLSPKVSIATDASGNFYMTGAVSDINTFDAISFDALNKGSLFVAGFDSMGTAQWFKNTQLQSISDAGAGIAIGSLNTLYVTGWFISDSFSFGGVKFKKDNLIGGREMVLIKMNTMGDVTWVRHSHGPAPDTRGEGISVNSDNSVFIAGRFGSPTTGGATDKDVTLGEGANAKLLKNGGLLDVFVAKYDADGNLVSSDIATGVEGHDCYAVTGDGSNSAYVTGVFSKDISFGSINLQTEPYPIGNNIFYAKYLSGVNAIEKSRITRLKVHPQPADNYLEIDVEGRFVSGNLEMLDLAGRIVLSEKITGQDHRLDVSGFENGLYILKLQNEGNRLSRKIMIRH